MKITNITSEAFRTFNPEADASSRRDLVIPGRESVEVGQDFGKSLTRDFPDILKAGNVKLPPLEEDADGGDDDTEEATS